MKVQIKYNDGRVRYVSSRDAKLLVSLKKAVYVTEVVEDVTPAEVVEPEAPAPAEPEGASAEVPEVPEVPEDTEVQKVLVPETVEAPAQTRTYRRRDMQAESGKSAPAKKAAKKVAPKKSAGRSAE